MDIYVNEKKQPTAEFSGLTGSEIVAKIQKEWPEEIIEEIRLDGEEVSLIFFQDKLDSGEGAEKAEFFLKDTSDLISETLTAASDYLPRLMSGIEEMAFMFRNQEIESARELYLEVLEGIEWTLETLTRIVSLQKDESLKQEFHVELKEQQKAVNRALEAFQNEDYQYLAEVFELEILDYLERFNQIVEEMQQ